MTLTVHGLQSDQTSDKVVKVYTHVVLRVAQDDQLEQVVIQLKTWKRKEQNAWNSSIPKCQNAPVSSVFLFFLSLFLTLKESKSITCGFKSHPHLIGAHAAWFVQVKLPEYGLALWYEQVERDRKKFFLQNWKKKFKQKLFQ